MAQRKMGRVEDTVRRKLTGRMSEPLAQVAVALARTIDEGQSVSALAATSRELRQVLAQLDILDGVERSPAPRQGDGKEPAGSVVDQLAARRRDREEGAG